MQELQIRTAVVTDAAAACEVVRASIGETCHADHKGNANLIAAWLNNKTPENFAAWIAEPSNHALVAVFMTEIVGLALLVASGELMLCYVRPTSQSRGVGRSLLQAVEAHARAAGLNELRLSSTATALPFYRRFDFENAGASVEFRGIESFPMVKRLR